MIDIPNDIPFPEFSPSGGGKTSPSILNADEIKTFIDAYTETYNFSEACRCIRRAQVLVREALDKMPHFARMSESAKESITDDLEATWMRRCLQGFQEEVFYKGEIVGHKTVFSVPLFLAFMKARRPEVWSSVEATGVDKDKVVRELQVQLESMHQSVPIPPALGGHPRAQS